MPTKVSISEEAQLLTHIGQLFRRRRVAELRMSLRGVEKATGVDSTLLNKLESGLVPHPTLRAIFRLAWFYHISVDDIIPSGGVAQLPETEVFLALADAFTRNATPDQLQHAATFLRLLMLGLDVEA